MKGTELTLAAVIFWLSVLLLAYVYAGYPLLTCALGRLLRRRLRPSVATPYRPAVTVVIAAFNEAEHIVATVTNKLAADYPPDKLDVIVVSDGSQDGTDELVRRIGDPRVRLIRQEPRAGKTAAVNLALQQATGEIVVFSDANSLYRPDTIGELTAALADPRVGYVTGRMVYRAPDGSLTGEGCSTYMSYENALRRCETLLGSIVGVDGGVDAMRRSLYQPLRPDQLPDFVQPLAVRELGHRVVYQPSALLYEDALAAAGDEFSMRVRVGLRAFHALKDMAVLLNPWRFGLFAWQMWSHKVLRYLAPLFMLGALVGNLFLIETGGLLWDLLLAGQALFYVGAVYGHLLRDRNPPRLIGLIYYLCLLNLASGLAFIQFLLGRRQITWKPRT